MMRKKLLAAPILLAIMLPLSACGGLSGDDAGSLSEVAPQSIDSNGGQGRKTSGSTLSAPAQKDAPPGSPTDVPADTQPGTVKYVIKAANLSVQVDDIEKKLAEARTTIQNHKGEVVYSTSRIKDRQMTASSYNGSPSDDRYAPPDYYPSYVVGDYALVRLDVPAADLEALLTDLRKLGKVVVDTTSSQDATLEVLGLEAQIQSTSKSLEGLEKLLTTAKSVDETLRVENAITERRGELASLQAQQNSLKQQAAKSSVTFQLVTDKAVKLTTGEKNWLQLTWDKISSASSDVVAILILGILFFAPVVALVILTIKFARLFLRSNKRRPDGALATPAAPKPTKPEEPSASEETIRE